MASARLWNDKQAHMRVCTGLKVPAYASSASPA
jgi:hypothetical protein